MSIEYSEIGEASRLYGADAGYDESHAYEEGNFTTFASSEDNETNSIDVDVDFGVVLSPNETDDFGTLAAAEGYGEKRNWVVVGILIGLIVILWIVLGIMLCVPLIRCIRRRMPVSKKRINRRYETIEGWLITKTVKSHDGGCRSLQAKFAQKTADVESQLKRVKHTESYDTADTTPALDDNSFPAEQDERDCPICMEHFQVGDVVSWSSYEACSHTYHHQCIKEWLLRHNNCPFCREVFLPVDNVHTKITMKVFKELSEVRAQRAEQTYYCIQDGLVTLEDKACIHSYLKIAPLTSAGPNILRKCYHIRGVEAVQLKEKLKAGVTKADLRKLRGNRCEKMYYENTPIPDIIEDQEVQATGDPAVENPNTLSLPSGDSEDRSNIAIEFEGAPRTRNDSSTSSSNGQGLSGSSGSTSDESSDAGENNAFQQTLDSTEEPFALVNRVSEESVQTGDESDAEGDISGVNVGDSLETNAHDDRQPCNTQSNLVIRDGAPDVHASTVNSRNSLCRINSDLEDSIEQVQPVTDNVTSGGVETTANCACPIIEKDARETCNEGLVMGTDLSPSNCASVNWGDVSDDKGKAKSLHQHATTHDSDHAEIENDDKGDDGDDHSKPVLPLIPDTVAEVKACDIDDEASVSSGPNDNHNSSSGTLACSDNSKNDGDSLSSMRGSPQRMASF